MKKSSTQTFREMVFARGILPSLRWNGTKMMFAYTWDGVRRFGVIEAQDLYGIIKWDK